MVLHESKPIASVTESAPLAFMAVVLLGTAVLVPALAHAQSPTANPGKLAQAEVTAATNAAAMNQLSAAQAEQA
jgi:hypothetical protein